MLSTPEQSSMASGWKATIILSPPSRDSRRHCLDVSGEVDTLYGEQETFHCVSSTIHLEKHKAARLGHRWLAIVIVPTVHVVHPFPPERRPKQITKCNFT